MMKILFCIHSLVSGGAENILVNTINELSRLDRFSIDLLILVNDRSLADKLDSNVRIISIFKNHSKIERRLVKYLPATLLNKMFVRGKYDIEIAFLEGDSTKVIGGANSRVPKVAWVHTDVNNFPWSTKFYISDRQEFETYKKYDRVLGVSKDVAREFTKKFNLPCSFAMNIIDYNTIIGKSREVLEETYEKDWFNFISVGSLKKIKGYERLITIYTKIKNMGLKVRQYIVGEGPERQFLEQKIKENNLQNYIILKGYKSNPYPWIFQADALVCCSYAEGYSSVVAEAIILKKVVITTECSGMREILGDSEWGVIVANNETALASGMLRIVEDKKWYNYYEQKAAERSKFFANSNQGKQLANIFFETVDKHE